jgi:hypothetical protein
MWLDRINRRAVWAGLPTKLRVAVSARDSQHWPTLCHHLLEPLLDVATTSHSEAVAMEIMLSWVLGCTAACRYST